MGTPAAQVLLIEDDATIRSALMRGLGERGHAVSSASNAMSGLRAALADRPDLVVLDLGLPDVDGAELLRMLRAASQVPVIVATARDDDADMVSALRQGADDYVVKPFSTAQLDARIAAVLRRSGAGRPDPAVRVGALTIDARSRVASLDGAELSLAPREFDLLHHLAVRAGEVISKRELATEVWHVPYGGADKTVDVHLAWLRRKLGETAAAPRYLHTVRGVGVKLTAPPDA
ncbi:MAG TPA: response regulator transcription factor [Actinocatenispora sp.]